MLRHWIIADARPGVGTGTAYGWVAAGAMGYLLARYGHLMARWVYDNSGGTSYMLKALDDGPISDESMAVLQTMDDSGEVGGEVWACPENYHKWASRLAAEAKCKFGFELTRSAANAQMVHEWLYKQLKDRNTRVSHMRRVLPRAVALTFLKDRDYLRFEGEINHPAIRRRAADHDRPWWAAWRPTWVEWALKVLFPGVIKRHPGFSN